MPIFDEFDEREEHAAKFNVTPRTIDRWRSEPDRLPCTFAGRTPLFKDEWTKAWLEARKRQRNPAPRRRGRRPAEARAQT